jgi:hypothetical protein
VISTLKPELNKKVIIVSQQKRHENFTPISCDTVLTKVRKMCWKCVFFALRKNRKNKPNKKKLKTEKHEKVVNFLW